MLQRGYSYPNRHGIGPFLASLQGGVRRYPGYGDHGKLTGLGDDDHTQYVLADGSRLATGEYRHRGDVLDDATFNLPVIANGARGVMVAGKDEERADFSIKDDGTVNLIMSSANVVANADIDGKICIGTSVASLCVIKNRLGATKAIMLQLWDN